MWRCSASDFGWQWPREAYWPCLPEVPSAGGGWMNHEYTVELRVWGETLDPDTVTRETGLQPCQIRRAGEWSHGRLRTTSMWAFDGESLYRGDSLEEGLALLLDLVEPLQDRFAKYISEYNVIWWCGHFQSSFDGGPELSGERLQRLGRFGAKLYIDNYFSNPEADTRKYTGLVCPKCRQPVAIINEKNPTLFRCAACRHEWTARIN